MQSPSNYPVSENKIQNSLTFFQKKGAVAATIFSCFWLLFILDYWISSGWWATRYDLSPAEFIGSICALFLPIVIAVLICAYLDRSTQLAHEANTLKAYLNELVYPTAEGAVYTQTLTQALRTQIKEFKSVFGQLNEQTASVRDDLRRWITDLGTIINHVDTQTIASVKEIAGHIQKLTAGTERANDQAQESAELFAKQATVLQQVINQMLVAVDKMAQVVSMNMEELKNTTHAIEMANERAETALGQAGEIAAGFQKGSKQMEHALISFESATQTQNEQLFSELEKALNIYKAQGALLQQEAHAVTETVANSQQRLQNSIAEVSDSALKGVGQVNEAGAFFNATTKNMLDTTGKLYNHIQLLTRLLTDKSDELRALMPASEVIYGGDFLKDAQTILDKLQEFSVDMARIFTPKAEDSLWQKYYGGDKAAFMRHITNEISSQQAKKIRQLYKNNQAFQEVVRKYMSGFEKLTTTISKNKNSELLISVLIGSDVGRLYMVLADILKKEEKCALN